MRYLLAFLLIVVSLPAQTTVYLRTTNPGNRATISTISQGATGPATVTTSGPHGLTTGDKADIQQVLYPCWEANGIRTVTVLSATQFTINDRAGTLPVRCTVAPTQGVLNRGVLIQSGGNSLALSDLQQDTTQTTGWFPRGIVSTSVFSQLTDGETVTGAGFPWGCQNLNQAVRVSKRSDGTVWFLDAGTSARVACLSYANFYNWTATVGKTTAVTLNTNTTLSLDTSIDWAGKAGQTVWQGLSGRVASISSAVNAPTPGTLAYQVALMANGEGAFPCAVGWKVTGNAQYLTCAKRLLLSFEYLNYGTFGAELGEYYSGRYYQNFSRISTADLMRAYVLVRDQFTAQERAQFAARVLNDNEDGCQNHWQPLSGIAVQNGNTVIGIGTSFSSQVATGDVVVTNARGDDYQVGTPTQLFIAEGDNGQVRLADQVVSNTIIKLQTGALVSGTGTTGAGAPTGSCNTGDVYVQTNYVYTWGTGNKSYACRAGTWNGTASDIRLLPMRVAKPFSTASTCGFLWAMGSLPISLRRDPNFFRKGGEGSTDPNHNLAHWAIFYELMSTLAVVNDDARAVRRLEASWNYLYDGQVPWMLNTWTGVQQYGSGYYAEINTYLTEVALAMKQATNGQVDIVTGKQWLKNSIYQQLYSYFPSKPAETIRYSETATTSGPSQIYFWRRGPVWERAADATEAALLRGWNYGLTGLHTASRYNTSAGSAEKFSALTLALSDPDLGTRTSPSTLPKQRLFRRTDTGDPFSDTYLLGAIASRSGWAATDTLLYADVSACCFDHMLFPSFGQYRIVRNGILSAPDNGRAVGDCADLGACYDTGDVSRKNIVQVGCASEANSSCYNTMFYPSSPFPRPYTRRWAGTDPDGVADGSYTYAMVDNSTNYRSNLGVTRAFRHFTHFKRTGQQDYIVVYDDIAASIPQVMRSLQIHSNNGRNGEGSVVWNAATNLMTSSNAASYQLNSQIVFPNSQQHLLVRSDVAAFPGRVADCITTDGSTCATVGAGEFMVVHQATTQGANMPNLTQLGSLSSGWRGLQIEDAQPRVAVFRQGSTLGAGLSFTSTHAGTGQYVVAGLGATTYSVRRNSTEITRCTVTLSDTTCPFDGASGNYQLVALGGNPAVNTTVLTDATRGVAYAQTLDVLGGVAPYSCSITAGTLPTGLTLSNCQISGTPTVAGTVSLTIVATDAAASNSVPAVLSLRVVDPGVVVISTATLPSGQTNVAYNGTVSAFGGVPPYSWSIVAGSLPSGLSLTNGGVFGGTPARSGNYGFTLRVTDAASQQAQQAYTLSIGEPLVTSQLMVGARGVAWTFGRQGLAASQDCVVRLCLPGQCATTAVETATIRGNSRRDWSSGSALTPATQYQVQAQCGADTVSETFSTLVSEGVDSNIQVTTSPRGAAGVASIRVLYGQTPNYGQQVAGPCVGVCWANFVWPRNGLVFYRIDYLNGSGQVIGSATRNRAVVVP